MRMHWWVSGRATILPASREKTPPKSEAAAPELNLTSEVEINQLLNDAQETDENMAQFLHQTVLNKILPSPASLRLFSHLSGQLQILADEVSAFSSSATGGRNFIARFPEPKNA